MKRIKSACICQTLHFMLKDDVPHEQAVEHAAYEVEHYKRELDRNRVKYKILEETTQANGSIIVKVIKQYNNSPVGEYLD